MVEVSFGNLFGRDFYAKFVWLRVSLHGVFGGDFSSDIFGFNLT